MCFLLSTALVFTGCKDTPDITDPNATETPGQESESESSTDKKDDTSKSDDATTDDAANDGTSDDGDAGDPTPKPSVLPVIRITTTSEVYKTKDFTDPLAFVKEPVSDSVKIHAHTYNELGHDSKPNPWYETCNITVSDEFNNVVLENVAAQVKSRGNYTTTYPKKGLRIKFDKKSEMLGLHNGEKYKNWVLLGCWKDLSMLRDYSAYKLAHLINNNYYAADSKLVEVYINDQYWGIYLLTEQQEDKRVGVTAEADDGQTAVGYLLEYDGYAEITEDHIHNKGNANPYIAPEDEDYFIFGVGKYGNYKDINGNIVGDSYGNHGYTIKSDYDDAKKAFIKDYMEKLWQICRDAIESNKYYEFDASYNLIDSTANSAQECIAKVVDIDSLVSAYILAEIACDLDLNWSSFYMDLDLAKGKKLTFEAPWDYDSCFGNHNERQLGMGGINHLFAVTASSPCVGNPWTILFAKTPWFQAKVQTKWAEMKTANVKGQLINEINKISNDPIYVKAFERNYTRWDNMDYPNSELPPAAASSKNQRQAADHLIGFFNQRFAMLDKDFKDFTPSDIPASNSITYNNSYEHKKADGTKVPRDYSVSLSVTANEAGLKIEWTCDSYWAHTYIIVKKQEDPDRILAQINDRDQNTHEYLYEHVEPGKVYKVTLQQMDENWQGWHETNAVTVKSIGGSGDLYMTFSPTIGSVYDGNKYNLNLGDYRISKDLQTPVHFDIQIFAGDPYSGVPDAAYYGVSLHEDESNTLVIEDTESVWRNGTTAKGMEFRSYYDPYRFVYGCRLE